MKSFFLCLLLWSSLIFAAVLPQAEVKSISYSDSDSESASFRTASEHDEKTGLNGTDIESDSDSKNRQTIALMHNGKGIMEFIDSPPDENGEYEVFLTYKGIEFLLLQEIENPKDVPVLKYNPETGKYKKERINFRDQPKQTKLEILKQQLKFEQRYAKLKLTQLLHTFKRKSRDAKEQLEDLIWELHEKWEDREFSKVT